VPTLRPDLRRGWLSLVRDLRMRSLHCCRSRSEPAIYRPHLRRSSEPHRFWMCRRGFRAARSPGSRDTLGDCDRVLACPRETDDSRAPPKPGGRCGRSDPGRVARIGRTVRGSDRCARLMYHGSFRRPSGVVRSRARGLGPL
jgi:hypothetical protein